MEQADGIHTHTGMYNSGYGSLSITFNQPAYIDSLTIGPLDMAPESLGISNMKPSTRDYVLHQLQLGLPLMLQQQKDGTYEVPLKIIPSEDELRLMQIVAEKGGTKHIFIWQTPSTISTVTPATAIEGETIKQ